MTVLGRRKRFGLAKFVRVPLSSPDVFRLKTSLILHTTTLKVVDYNRLTDVTQSLLWPDCTFSTLQLPTCS